MLPEPRTDLAIGGSRQAGDNGWRRGFGARQRQTFPKKDILLRRCLLLEGTYLALPGLLNRCLAPAHGLRRVTVRLQPYP